MYNNADVVVDLQYGSTGKGLIAGYLSNIVHYDVAVSANMPNAGHTYIDRWRRKWVFKVLPTSCISHDCEWALIGPGAVFDPEVLMEEIGKLRDHGYECRVGVHPNAMVLRPDHVKFEAELVEAIGSTGQGSMAATIEKMRRRHNPNVIAVDYAPIPGANVLTHDEYNDILSSAYQVMAEGAQGYSLGINERFYPYCTSRDCTVTATLQACGIPQTAVRYVIGTCRTYPIRVGGNSGPCYPDQDEISWEDVGVIPEKTTVTQRDRRIFTFSCQQIADAIWANRPHFIFLNFANYSTKNKTGYRQIIEHMNGYMQMLYRGNQYGAVRWLGFGPADEDVQEIEFDV